jgi:hypothetical protein
LEAVLEKVRHGPELDRALSRKRLHDGARAASAAADQGDLDGVVFRCVAGPRQRRDKRCAGGGTGGCGEELTPGERLCGDEIVLIVVHESSLL